ncbi:hypothetical protein ABZY09_30420 [Streptomyces sp. NPDC002928]
MGLIKRCRAAFQERAGEIGWSVAGGAIGAAIGLLFSAFWLRVQ